MLTAKQEGPSVIRLHPSSVTEIAQFCTFESLSDVRNFIIPYSPDKHLAEMANPKRVYLSIYKQTQLVGFIILALDGEKSVEFRRIVVAEQGHGIGQAAMLAMEMYCTQQLDRHRIWLDVFAFNTRGQHIYQKMSYNLFSKTEFDGKPLLLMEKEL